MAVGEQTVVNRGGTKLLIVSPGIPHESRGASTVLFFHYINGFKKAGFHILNLLLLQADNYTEEGLVEYSRKITEPGKFEVLACRAGNFLMSRRLDFQLNLDVMREALHRAERFEPEGIVCFDLLSAWVGTKLEGSAKVAWLGDLRFQTEWYHALYAVRERWLAIRGLPLVWFRCQSWKRIYRDVLRQMDSIVVSARSSEEHLLRLGLTAVYQPYPWPNQHGGLGGRVPKQDGVPSFLFLGTLTGLGSRAAFHFMLRTLYRPLVRVWGKEGFQILIAGTRGLPGWVQSELKEKPEFKYLGFVEDLDSVMDSCHAVLTPIDVPVGNRSRIVTAMAKGTLVIAHENAALGNPDLVDGVTCYLARDAGAFIDRMRKAVEHPEDVARIVRRARERYEARFEPEVAAGMFLSEVERVMRLRRGG